MRIFAQATLLDHVHYIDHNHNIQNVSQALKPESKVYLASMPQLVSLLPLHHARPFTFGFFDRMAAETPSFVLVQKVYQMQGRFFQLTVDIGQPQFMRMGEPWLFARIEIGTNLPAGWLPIFNLNIREWLHQAGLQFARATDNMHLRISAHWRDLNFLLIEIAGLTEAQKVLFFYFLETFPEPLI